MFHRSLVALFLAAVPLFGCDTISDALPELTLGKEDGIPPIQGSTAIDIPQDYKCGDPIEDPQKRYTVTSSGTAEACTFLFQQDVLALKAEDYANKPEMKGTQFVKSVDIDVNALAIRDGASDMPISPIDLNGKAFDTTILTKEDLGRPPPYTKSITGAPVDALKSIIQQQKDLIIPVDITVVVNMAPTPPAKIALDFDAQPNIVLGF